MGTHLELSMFRTTDWVLTHLADTLPKYNTVVLFQEPEPVISREFAAAKQQINFS